MMGWYGNGMMGGFGLGLGLLGGVINLLFFIAVIYLIVILVKKLMNQPSAIDKSQAILNERLAKGEITEEEYQKLKKILNG
ncbi:hypothetical protein E4665_03650 [Sporolactobacillus shoreae]|uniref:SHOCT domain-containing protein n=1 Tax=Sporolactobacillus shoreae TaxID=1465501 RepID=A0A4Z0GQ91_9BACL|nr:SHOCT domain-containing protein [Sporolactobacillus shoreae]TGA99434.1 hypothetical protein E4665_03650 [Sporolactobacillus shoreae]